MQRENAIKFHALAWGERDFKLPACVIPLATIRKWFKELSIHVHVSACTHRLSHTGIRVGLRYYYLIDMK